MKLLFILTQLTLAITLFGQTRLTNDPASSYTSDNNTQCIASSGPFVHVVWTDDRTGNNEIFYKRSHNSGDFWDGDDQLSLSFSDASFPSIAAYDHAVHVVWMDLRNGKSNIYYKRSLNDGLTWGDDVLLTDHIGQQFHPSIAVSGQNIHVVWQADDHEASEIWYLESIDGGSTWLPEMRLSNALSNALKPSITVDDANVHVVWSKTNGTGIYHRHSLDNGSTWLPQNELTTTSSYSSQPMITTSDSIIFVFWLDNRGGSNKVYMRRSVDNGSTWENDVKMPSHNHQADRPRAASQGPYVYLVWNELNLSDTAIFETISTDAGVSWIGARLSEISHGNSTRPFISLNENDVHIISTEESDGNKEIYYNHSENGNPFLDRNTYAWGHGLGSSGNDVAKDVVLDSSGNVYVTGFFENTIDIDPGPDVVNLVSAGSADIFIAKFNAAGSLQWAKSAGGNGDDVAYALSLDHHGHVFATGSFSQTVSFDPGNATHDLTSFGDADIFVLKLDTSGQVVWVKQMGGDGLDEGRSVAVDSTGNVLTTGYFSNTADLDPSVNVDDHLSNGFTDIFISKLNPDGEFLWNEVVGGPSIDAAHSITIDNNQSILLTGFYTDSVDFDPGADSRLLLSNGLKDVFVLKLNQDGHLEWADSFGADQDDEANAIVCDPVGNIYSTGNFSSMVDFNPDTSNTAFLNAGGVSNVYVSKLNKDGQYIWAKHFHGSADEGNDIALDDFGNVYTTGSFESSTDFDPGQKQLSLFANDLNDVFISKLLSDGSYVWVNQLSGTNAAQGNAIATWESSYVYCAGNYSGNIDLDPTSSIDLKQNQGGANDFFLMQLKQCEPSSTILNINACTSYLSPDGHTLWTSSGTYENIIPTSLGCDSVITIHLTVVNPTQEDIEVSGCNAYISPQGNTWTSSGTYPVELINIAGCDSIINYHVTIYHSSSTEFDVSACNQYTTEDGLHTWTESGSYPLGYININGCDSNIIYHVTIFQPDTTNIQAASCNQYTTPDGLNTWTESGSYPFNFTNMNGCDSIVTYEVTILHSSASSVEATSCNEYSAPDGFHTWTATGSYPVTLINSVGCDSVITYNVTILHDRDTTFSVIACDQFTTPDGLHTWDTSGEYDYTIATSTGCDSLITLNLSIVNLDTSVTVTEQSLSSNQAGTTYQWLDCDQETIIQGATTQTFTPSVNGSYAVIVSSNDCTDTSSCYQVTLTGIHNIGNDDEAKIYPNPAHNLIYIDLMQVYSNISIEINSPGGKSLLKNSFHDQRILELHPELAPGLYLISIERDGMTVLKKLVVQ